MLATVNVTERTCNWNSVNWRQANRIVRNLRQRIFKATQEGNQKKVRGLQRLMLRSYSNILLAVRRVTQINKGKNTAGIDKVIIKTPEARGQLVDELTKLAPWKPYPTKRVYIPKTGSNKKRPLGIPVITDRCLQAIVKNALEPYWEAQFEGSSYGFRPGRSAHDAREKIYNIARPNQRKKWVIDADIKGCFDNIAHSPLMNVIGNFPSRKLIYEWLKAGVMDNGVYHETKTGTPQGGVISPLLANIALHGLEECLDIKIDKHGRLLKSKRALVRYADDFVVFCESKEDAIEAVEILKDWLIKRGLTLSEEKTRIIHISEGFDFLGYNVKHYTVSNSKTGWKLLIKPSRKSVKAIKEELRQIWLNHKSKNLNNLINKINPVIRGWANYQRVAVASETFDELDRWMYQREVRYAKHTHSQKNNKWIKRKYWGRFNLDRHDRWTFGDKQTGNHITKFKWTGIKRHRLVKGRSSPDDPTLRRYWERKTEEQSKELIPSRQKIAKKQNNKCQICGISLYNDEEIQLHHKVPRSKGGKDTYSNLELVHLYCHQQIHS